MLCNYVDGNFAFDYSWTKDGANFQPSIQSVGNGVLATVPVPNGEYRSSLEGIYTCRVSLGGATRGSRNIIVALPGEPWPVCTSPTSHIHSWEVHDLGSVLCCVVLSVMLSKIPCQLHS